MGTASPGCKPRAAGRPGGWGHALGPCVYTILYSTTANPVKPVSMTGRTR